MRVPKALRNEWPMAVLYILIVFVGIHVLAIHRVPHRMAIYMLVLLGMALGAGLLFEKRAFCTHFCPVGLLLGLYARVAPLEWRVRNKETCAECKDKLCVSAERRDKWYGRACPNGLYPARIETNTDCILCTQCHKACPHDNLRLSTRPFLKGLFSEVRLSTPQIGFLIVVSGFVIYEILSEWSPSKDVLMYIPQHVSYLTGVAGQWPEGLVNAVLLFGVLPAILWSIWPAVGKLARIRIPLSDYFARYGAAYIPIMAAAHIDKSLQKMTTRLDYIPGAIEDPAGTKTAAAILDGTLTVPSTMQDLIHPVLDWVLPLVIAGSLWAAYKVVRSQHRAAGGADKRAWVLPFFGVSVYWCIFMVVVVLWRFS